MEAWFYTKLTDEKVRCQLCPHQCLLKTGQTGICHVRQNQSGILHTLNYGKVSAKHTDPIEKKPLYHFFPGSHILSLGSVGCNMQCTFCQNCEISQVGISEYAWIGNHSPEQIVDEALKTRGNIGVAYTYNEPSIFYEFMYDTALKVHDAGLKNVMVTNGFLSLEPLRRLLPITDAFNVDLKAYSESFYKKYTHSQLEPVLSSLKMIGYSGKHLEITMLVIPGLNDDTRLFRQMISWIVNELGNQTVLHLSRYFPNYHMKIEITPERTLLNLLQIAKSKLKFVYVGNLHSTSVNNNTYCPKCDSLAITRNNYEVTMKNITADGKCSLCGYQLVKNS